MESRRLERPVRQVDAQSEGEFQEKDNFNQTGHEIEYDEISAVQSKCVIDEIDTALAEFFTLSSSELDFVMHYDLKYRVGSETDQESYVVAITAAN